jgi:thiol-disulfide isomerase/thioredoxin
VNTAIGGNAPRWAVAVIVTGIAAAMAWRGMTGTDPSVDLSLTTITGERLDLREWRGPPIVLAFWSSDCKSCREELPALLDLHREYAPRGLRVVLVAVPHDLPSRIVALARQQGWPFLVALDPKGMAAESLRVRYVPANFLIGEGGRVILSRLGKIDPAAFRAALGPLLPRG